MKIQLLLIAALCACAWGYEISGAVKLQDGSPLKECLVSDGHSIVKTDATGRYTLELHPKAVTVYVHCTSGITGEQFHCLLNDEQAEYNFTLSESSNDAPDKLEVLIVGDPETNNVSYMDELADYIQVNPGIDFVLVAGDICRRDGMEAHRKGLTPERFPRPVYYVVGNHDIDDRKPDEPGAFVELMAPWYYTFEHDGILFIAAPMYNSWGAPLPYDMKDFGDWLKKVLTLFPQEQPKVMICHDIVDLVGEVVPTHSEPVQLNDHNFKAILYGHKHCNIVMNHEHGRKSYSTATTTIGGVGYFAPSFRYFSLDTDGTQHSSIIYSQLYQLLQAGSDGQKVWATAANSRDQVVKVFCTDANGVQHDLEKNTELGWSTTAPAAESSQVTAVTKSGVEFSASLNNAGNRIRLVTALPQEAAMSDLLIDGDTLYAAVVDDAMSEQGGVYAIDRISGKILWKCNTRYSIRNNMAQDKTCVYWIDARGNIGATLKKNGELKWLNPADLTILSPSGSGVTLCNGIVAGGYGQLFRGVRAANGATAWMDKSWTERTPGEDKLTSENGIIYVISQLNGLFAYRAATGEKLWNFKKLFLSATAVPAQDCVYVKGEYEMYKLDKSNGKQLAAKRIGKLKTASVPVLYGDTLIMGTMEEGVVALNQAGLERKWSFKPGKTLLETSYYAKNKPATVETTVFLKGEYIVFGAGDGWIYILRADNGQLQEKFFGGAPFAAKPVLAQDGKFYFLDMAGRILELN